MPLQAYNGIYCHQAPIVKSWPTHASSAYTTRTPFWHTLGKWGRIDAYSMCQELSQHIVHKCDVNRPLVVSDRSVNKLSDGFQKQPAELWAQLWTILTNSPDFHGSLPEIGLQKRRAYANIPQKRAFPDPFGGLPGQAGEFPGGGAKISRIQG